MKTLLLALLFLASTLTDLFAAEVPAKGFAVYFVPPGTYRLAEEFVLFHKSDPFCKITSLDGRKKEFRTSGLLGVVSYPEQNSSTEDADTAIALIKSLLSATPEREAQAKLQAGLSKWTNARAFAVQEEVKRKSIPTPQRKEFNSLEVSGIRYSDVTLNSSDGNTATVSHADGIAKIEIAKLTSQQITLLNATSGKVRINLSAPLNKLKQASATLPVRNGHDTPIELNTAAADRNPSLLSGGQSPSDIEIVASFLKYNNLNSVSEMKDGNSPLHIAVRDIRNAYDNEELQKKIAVIRALINLGANVNCKGQDGGIPLHELMWSNAASLQGAVLLLDAGANPNAKTDTGENVLGGAAAAGSREAIQLLIARGAQVNQLDNRGQTALFACASAGPNHVEAADLLISRGASVLMKDLSGQTPLHHAALSNAKNLVECLIRNKAEIDAVDAKGRTPLHIAAAQSAGEIAISLSEAGADPGIRDLTGAKPAYLASEAENGALAELLTGADRQRHGGIATSGRDRTPRAKGFPYGMIVFATLTGFIAMIGVYVIGRLLKSRLLKISALSLATLSALACIGSICGFHIHSQIVNSPEAVLQSYLSASQWQDKLRFVHFPERVKPLMQRYYSSDFKWKPSKISSSEIDSLGNIYFKVNYGEKDDATYYVTRKEGKYAVDWEASVGWSEMSGVEFMSKKPPFPVLIRGLAQLDTFYFGKYSSGLLWTSVRVWTQDGASIRAYARRHSACGEALDSWFKNGGSRRTALKLRFNEEAEIVDACLEWDIP